MTCITWVWSSLVGKTLQATDYTANRIAKTAVQDINNGECLVNYELARKSKKDFLYVFYRGGHPINNDFQWILYWNDFDNVEVLCHSLNWLQFIFSFDKAYFETKTT